VVKNIIETHNRAVDDIIANHAFLTSLNANDYINDSFGLLTIKDIVKELEKPGRDPRPVFKTATFKEGVEKVSDLQPSMILEGVITNVTNFGAFVDIGVHQDGLVHISSLTDKFVADPSEVVKAGDIVKVKVLEVDVNRKRISLTMRLEEQPKPANANKKAPTENRAQQKKAPAQK
ncbi:S1 RNA-binding domain-containing protein, partial [Terrabacter carboxydivorans]